MSKGNFVKLYDTVEFRFLDPNLKKVKDDYEGAFKPQIPTKPHISGLGSLPGQAPQSTDQSQQQNTPKGLLVTIAASHSGIITRNNGFYLPDKMKRGSASFTKDFSKPVLLHHEDHKDPVGRIYKSTYVDTSGAIVDKYKGLEVKNKAGKVIGTITDTLIKDFNSGAMPFAQQIDITRSMFTDSILEDEGYEGLGHIQIVANITDQAAIQKLLDGRYLTGSVGATTDSATCSVCRIDWTDSGMCEHKPGAIYDGSKCFIIAGNLIYDEYSFVNVPADRHSRVLQLSYNGIQDNVTVVDDGKKRIYEVNLEFPQYTMEDNTMAAGNVQIQDSVSTETPVMETLVIETVSTPDTTVVTDQTVTTEPIVPATTTEIVQDAVQPTLDDLITKLLDKDATLTEEEHEALYTIMWTEVVDCAKSGVLIMDEKALVDAKLSIEKRKSLPKSTFCGPDKSFPVPDCAHVTAARRLINRYKGPGDKTAILTCVTRKAKAMGCDTTKDEVIQDNSHQHSRMMHMVLSLMEENTYAKEYGDKQPTLTEEEKSSLVGMLKRLAPLVGKDAVINVLTEINFIPNEKDLLDEIIKHEENVGSLNDRVKALQEEYNALFEDMNVMQDSLIKEKIEKRKTKEVHLELLSALKDTKVEKTDFTSLTDAVLDQEVERFAKEVDIKKITDKLNDGIARQPTETVANPIAIQDNSKQVSVQDLAKIEEHYMYLRFTRGELAAEAYLSAMRREGKLPQNDN